MEAFVGLALVVKWRWVVEVCSVQRTVPVVLLVLVGFAQEQLPASYWVCWEV